MEVTPIPEEMIRNVPTPKFPLSGQFPALEIPPVSFPKGASKILCIAARYQQR